jgi:hypothetical protein
MLSSSPRRRGAKLEAAWSGKGGIAVFPRLVAFLQRDGGSIGAMADTTITDRRASADEVRANADALKNAARDVGVTDVRILADGTLVVHSDDEGLRQVIALVARARGIVGSYVHVITDDVPAAEGARSL